MLSSAENHGMLSERGDWHRSIPIAFVRPVDRDGLQHADLSISLVDIVESRSRLTNMNSIPLSTVDRELLFVVPSTTGMWFLCQVAKMSTDDPLSLLVGYEEFHNIR